MQLLPSFRIRRFCGLQHTKSHVHNSQSAVTGITFSSDTPSWLCLANGECILKNVGLFLAFNGVLSISSFCQVSFLQNNGHRNILFRCVCLAFHCHNDNIIDKREAYFMVAECDVTFLSPATSSKNAILIIQTLENQS